MHDGAKKFETVTLSLNELEPLQPGALDERRIEALANDIRDNGLKEPLLVATDTMPPEKWYVIDGRHRLEALRRLGWAETHAVWAPTLVPEDILARVLWRRKPAEVERVWALIARAARSLETTHEEAHRFLLDFIQALHRARAVFGDIPVAEAISLARATLEEAEEGAAPPSSSLRETLEFLGSNRARNTALHLSEAGVHDWAEYLHGRLRLLVLPTSFLKNAVRNGISASMLFTLKSALEQGAPETLVEAYLEEPGANNLARLEPWVRPGDEREGPADRIITKTRKLARLIRKKLHDVKDPSLLSRLSDVLAEAEKILEEAST